MSAHTPRLVYRVRAVATSPSRSLQEILDELSEARAEIDCWIEALEAEHSEDTDESMT